MKLIYPLISTILFTSCALDSEFIPKEGKTISQVNSDSYIYCAGRAKADRKYIVLEGSHPYIKNIQIYKNTIFDEPLSKNDSDLFKSRKCDEPLFFIDGKSISSAKVKELESAIPQEKRDAGIAQSKANKEAELRELKRSKATKEAELRELKQKELSETPNVLEQKLKDVRLKINEFNRIMKEKNRWDLRFAPEIQDLEHEERMIEKKLKHFAFLEQQEKNRQKQMQENEIIKKNEEYRNSEILKQNKIIDACLNSGKISVCALYSSSPRYVCGRQLILGMWTNRYCGDTTQSEISFKSKNNLNTTVKDIIYKCESIAKSGTVLGSNDVKIFDIWNPGELKDVTLTIPKTSQTNSYNCFVKSWK
jgi:hypothetical protein